MIRRSMLAAILIFCAGAVQVDLSSPKEAAKSLYRAVQAGEAEAIVQTLDSDADHQPLVGALAELLVTTKQLGDAAKAKFGDAAGKLGSGTSIPEDLQQIESAEVSEKDGTATIKIANQLAPMVFHKRDGGWKLDITDYFNAHESIGSQTKLLKTFSEQLKLVTEEMIAGRYTTPAEAETAIQQRFNEVMIKSTGPASQPATAPAK